MTYSNELRLKIINCIKLNKYSDTEIMEIFDISKDTFYKIKKQTKIGFLNGSKRITKITNTIKIYIKNYVIRRINFNYKKLIRLIFKKFNIIISKSTIYNVLKKQKIKKKKLYSKQILTKSNKRRKQIKIFKNQLKKTLIEDIISIDETSIDTHIGYNYGWSKYGEQIVIIKNHIKIRYTLVLATGFNGIIHYKIIKGSCNGEIFLNFIKKLFTKILKTKKWGIILDNARIHHYLKLKNYVKMFDNINIIYNVPYSPESNPIEQLFKDVKKYLKDIPINNTNILCKIKKSFGALKKSNINEYFKESYNFY